MYRLPPLFQVMSSLVFRVDEHLWVLISRIQTFSIIIADSRCSQSHHWPLCVVWVSCISTPEWNSDAKFALIRDHHVSPVFHWAGLLDVDLGQLRDRNDTSDSIDRAHLLKLWNFTYRYKTEPLRRNRHIILKLLNCRVFIENYTVVIFDTCVFLICHFDLTIRKSVNLVLLQLSFKVLGLVIEKCGLDLTALIIYQLDI